MALIFPVGWIDPLERRRSVYGVHGGGFRAAALTSFQIHGNISPMSLTPQAVQALLDEVEASRASRKRAWENLQEIRWVLKDAAGVELPPPERKTIDLEGRLVKDGLRKL